MGALYTLIAFSFIILFVLVLRPSSSNEQVIIITKGFLRVLIIATTTFAMILAYREGVHESLMSTIFSVSG